MEIKLKWLHSKNLIRLCLFFFCAFVLALSTLAFINYLGHGYIYILFTLISNLLLYMGFRKKAIFFDTFIGVFFWLGFWLKLTVRIAFSNGIFSMAPYFNATGSAFDTGLLVCICGLSGLALASYLREKFFYIYPERIEGIEQKGLFTLYVRYRKISWVLFSLLVIFIALSNAYLGIYQRGTLPQTMLPFALNGVYTWLLMFGMASIAVVMLRFEFEINKKIPITVVILTLMEAFLSNTSMLSRGMLLSGGAFLYGVISAIKKYSIKSNRKILIMIFVSFIFLFSSSVLTVNYLRLSIFSSTSSTNTTAVKGMTTPLFVDRWIGVEEILAVSSYPALGWNLWNEAWKENPTKTNEVTHFYDRTFSKTPQIQIDRNKFHFIQTLPGVMAFFFYPGSYWFLFISMLLIGIFAASLEYMSYKLSGKNVILAACIAQIIAFRLSNFGYAPAQSYLLIGSIIMNLVIIYSAEKLSRLFIANNS